MLGPPLLASICPRGVRQLVMYSTAVVGQQSAYLDEEHIMRDCMCVLVELYAACPQNLHQGKNKPNDATHAAAPRAVKHG